jgi:hypothetical protein
VEERAVLHTIFNTWRTGNEKSPLGLMTDCFRHTSTTENNICLLLDLLAAKEDNDTYVHHASLHSSCVAIETCLDRIHLVDTVLADRLLLAMATNQNTGIGSRPLAHILQRLLRHASLKGVERAKNEICTSTYSIHAMYLFLVEHTRLHSGWSVNDVSDEEGFLWLLQRNPLKLAAFLSHKHCPLDPYTLKDRIVWKQAFFARQEPVRSALCSDTPLARELIELVLQYR